MIHLEVSWPTKMAQLLARKVIGIKYLLLSLQDDTQLNVVQHYGLSIRDTQQECHNGMAGCRYTECSIFIVILSVIMLYVVILNVVKLSVVASPSDDLKSHTPAFELCHKKLSV